MSSKNSHSVRKQDWRSLIRSLWAEEKQNPTFLRRIILRPGSCPKVLEYLLYLWKPWVPASELNEISQNHSGCSVHYRGCGHKMPEVTEETMSVRGLDPSGNNVTMRNASILNGFMTNNSSDGLALGCERSKIIVVKTTDWVQVDKACFGINGNETMVREVLGSKRPKCHFEIFHGWIDLESVVDIRAGWVSWKSSTYPGMHSAGWMSTNRNAWRSGDYRGTREENQEVSSRKVNIK